MSNVAAPSPAQHSTYYSYYPPSCGNEVSQTTYRALVDSVVADKQSYSPGGTITLSGRVELQSYTFYQDSCQCYGGSGWASADPSTAIVFIELWVNSDWSAVSANVSPDSNGNFLVTYQVPQSQPVGSLILRVTASPPSSEVWYQGCSPLSTSDEALGHKGLEVSIQAAPPTVTLTVTPLSGLPPFTPNYTYYVNNGKSPYHEIIYWGDGTSYDAGNGCDNHCPFHMYNNTGTFTITLDVTDANGATASASQTIVVTPSVTATSAVASTSSAPGPVLIPAITGCDPVITIVMMIITIVLAVAIALFVFRWMVRRRPGAALIVAVVVGVIIGVFVGAIMLGGPANVCGPGTVWIFSIVMIVIIIVIFRQWIIVPPPPPPPPPGGGGRLNVRGNATATQTNGTRTQLNTNNLNQVRPGSSIETQNNSYVRLQTPLSSRSETTIGENSSVEWLDPALRSAISWLKLPGPAQIYNIERTLLRLDFGKLLLNWVEPAAEKEALIILPAGLISTAASAAVSRWLARVKGTMVLVEAVPGGSSAAITVLEGDDPSKPSSVELWRSDDLKVIQINPGERVILTTDQAPTKASLKLAKGLTWDIEDPFRLLHKYWTLPPMSPETNDALIGTSPKPGEGTTDEAIQYCTNCSRKIPRGVKFCPYCAAEQPHLP